MKPHALRRGLWLANFALAAAVLGLGAWYFLEVRPAVAAAVKKDPKNKRPEYLGALLSDYEKMRVSGLKWKPQAPVSDKELDATILRKDYKDKDPEHWVFCGPLPPEAKKSDIPVVTGPPPPEGLDTLGKIISVFIAPPRSTILFQFQGGKARAFGVGAFVKLSSKEDPDRFKLTAILESEPEVYVTRYEVYGQDANKPERTAELVTDRRASRKAYDFLRPDRPAGEADPAAATPGATAPGGLAGEGPAGDGATGEGEPGAPAEVVRVGRKPTAALQLDDLKPEIIFNPKNRNQKAIIFDDNTYRYFKSRNAKGIANTVKTQVAKDKTTGQVIGLRITGLDGAPSGVFDVRKGDILVSINGSKITSRGEAVRVAESLKEATLVTVVIDRRGKLVTYRVDPRDPRNRRKVRYFEGFSRN